MILDTCLSLSKEETSRPIFYSKCVSGNRLTFLDYVDLILCKLILTLVDFRFTLGLIYVYLVLCESSVMSLLKIYQIACVVINSPWKFPVALLKIY